VAAQADRQIWRPWVEILNCMVSQQKLKKKIIKKMTDVLKAECRLGDHQFADRFYDKNVSFYILSMKDSFLLWVGESAPKLQHLAVAMQTRFVSIFKM